MRNILSKRGDGYVDVCIGIIAFVIVLIISFNIFEFISLKVEMDEIADRLIESATYSGGFEADYERAIEDTQDEYFQYEEKHGADRYFNSTLNRVQLGERMWITVSVKTNIKGIGIKIPITLSVKKSGLSERYWK